MHALTEQRPEHDSWCTSAGNVAFGLKDALRRLATTPGVVTLNVDGQHAAITMTAITGLSLDPPSLLLCVNKSARVHQAIKGGIAFCVNLLGQDNLAVAQCCAGPSGTDRFACGAWLQFDDGTPYLADAQANIHCRLEESICYGTHEIFVGRVDAVRTYGEVAPLVYVNGGFARAERVLTK